MFKFVPWRWWEQRDGTLAKWYRGASAIITIGVYQYVSFPHVIVHYVCMMIPRYICSFARMSNQRDRSEFTISSNKDTSEIDAFEDWKEARNYQWEIQRCIKIPWNFQARGTWNKNCPQKTMQHRQAADYWQRRKSKMSNSSLGSCSRKLPWSENIGLRWWCWNCSPPTRRPCQVLSNRWAQHAPFGRDGRSVDPREIWREESSWEQHG